ncbi:hypothetical protein [Kribbia dieselivorans]|uniref:hypothetical protein n=1 Tax=Kribbia dieselivorans TaxID=331526 RepID=UPI0012ED4102|nr:hypothetical protein [Kribbia dieselivorans]
MADPGAIIFGEPVLAVAGQTYAHGEPVESWDYATPFTVIMSVTVDRERFLESTGLSTLDGVVACVAVDCKVSGTRYVERLPLPASGAPADIRVHIGPHQVAQAVEVTPSVVLDSAEGLENPEMVAFRRGSRLISSTRSYRFPLEGSATLFPTEAFSFAAAGFPSGAAWKLNFDPDEIDDPYLGAVRLLINTDHPISGELLSGEPTLARSVLFHEVIAQMLLTVAGSFRTIPTEFEEDSVGAAMNHLAETYLGLSLAQAVDALGNDRAETLCRLQDRTAFMNVRATS